MAETFDHRVCTEQVSGRLGISSRSLRDRVHDQCGTSPAKFLRRVRLQRVRSALLAANAGITVTDVAVSLGFYQLGRFARLYRDQFGELPSETLRRR